MWPTWFRLNRRELRFGIVHDPVELRNLQTSTHATIWSYHPVSRYLVIIWDQQPIIANGSVRSRFEAPDSKTSFLH